MASVALIVFQLSPSILRGLHVILSQFRSTMSWIVPHQCVFHRVWMGVKIVWVEVRQLIQHVGKPLCIEHDSKHRGLSKIEYQMLRSSGLCFQYPFFFKRFRFLSPVMLICLSFLVSHDMNLCQFDSNIHCIFPINRIVVFNDFLSPSRGT